MPIPKLNLYERGVTLAVALCRANHLRPPKFRNNPRLRSTGLYTSDYRVVYAASDPGKQRGTVRAIHDALVQVNVDATAWLVNNPTVRRQSHPGWKTDRTALGVVVHELGHHVWYRGSTGKAHAAWRAVFRATRHSERVSGYEPVAEEAHAETFRLWCLNPSLLQAACPQRYECLVNDFGLRHIDHQPWRKVLPKAFHARAVEWIDR